MSFLSTIFGCNSNSREKKIVEIDGEKIETIPSKYPLEANYGLKDLTDDQMSNFAAILLKTKPLLEKYSYNHNDTNNIDARILDLVLEKWKHDKSYDKASKEEIIEMIGCAFGQDIVDDLDCEWKVLTDEYGTDFTVIHKKYKINGFPFSSVLKAIDEDRQGSLYDIKLVMKKGILDAENGADYEER